MRGEKLTYLGRYLHVSVKRLCLERGYLSHREEKGSLETMPFNIARLHVVNIGIYCHAHEFVQ